MSDAPDEKPQFQLTRPSASADASRAAEKARLRAMSPLERALRALELGLMCQRLLPVVEDAAARAK